MGTLRTKPDKVLQVVELLVEGMSIRGAARIARCHRDTVLRILKHAGQRSYDLLNRKLVDIPVKHVEGDEIWTFVQKKSEPDTDPETDTAPTGDFYVFLGIESDTKLLLLPTIGKRTENKTWNFAQNIKQSTSGRFQITTDGFRPYKNAIVNTLGDRVDFAQFYKEHNMRKANPNFDATLKDSEHPFVVRCGTPNERRITTAHVERVNLTLRTHNKRFNRKTICFSKDEEYLAYSVYLFTAHHNFCRTHLTHGETPAVKSGIAESKWSINDLIANAL